MRRVCASMETLIIRLGRFFCPACKCSISRCVVLETGAEVKCPTCHRVCEEGVGEEV